MKDNMGLILASLMVASCGGVVYDCIAFANGAPIERQGIRFEVAPYVKAWEQETGMLVDYWVGFAPLDAGRAGECRTWDNGYHEIRLDRLGWEGYTHEQRKALIWHELGHCSLHLEHNEAIQNNGCPVDVMFPSVPPDICLTMGGTSYDI